MSQRSVVVVGAGIVGLASARELQRRGALVTVIDKEQGPAAHQTGRNSGVVHSGIYYRPGSLKATMCRAGAESMLRFAEEYGIAHDRCGKLIVATSDHERDRLRALYERGVANGIPVRLLGAEEARDYEPYVNVTEAIRVESTAIIDYVGVCNELVRQLREGGADIRFGQKVEEIALDGSAVRVETSTSTVRAGRLVNCAGLHSDRVARQMMGRLDVRIVPFRGEYFELAEEAWHLVRSLVYPVPDPDLPFLGVHLTKMVHGGVHAGPNAVLALAREGYRWRDVNVRDVVDTAAFRGTWHVARTHFRTGIDEVLRSWSRRRFLASLQRLVPDLQAHHLVRSPAGVRAQAVDRQGRLLDDFRIERNGPCVHVLNAPSPAATSALEIGTQIAAMVEAES